MKKQQLVVSFPSYKLGTFHNPLPDIGRNDPCPCKSGKKYKRCCGMKHDAVIAAKCVDVSKRNTGYTPPAAPAPIPAAPCTNAPATNIPPATVSLLRRGFRKGLALIKKNRPEVKP